MSTRGIQHVAAVVTVALLALAVAPLATATGASAAVATPPVTLRSVAMLSGTTALAAAANGSIWRTTTAGDDWVQVRGASAYDFRAIDFWNNNLGVAVDYNGRAASTVDGGLTWANIDFRPLEDMDGDAAEYSHHGLACVPGTTNVAVSVGGDSAIDDGTWTGPLAMRTQNSLANWKQPLFSAEPYWYNDGLGNLYEVGEGEFLDVDFVDSTNGWAAGRDTYTDASKAKHTGTVYHTTDGGVSWGMLTITLPATMNAVSFGSTTAGVIAGQLVSDGTPRAYYTTDGGLSWTPGTLPTGAGTPRALHMTSATAGWLAGDGGTLLRTTDGGMTWIACTIPAGIEADLYDVELVGTTGIAVGAGTVLTTTDGITWEGETVSTEELVIPPVAGADRIGTAIEASRVAFPDGSGGASTVVIATARNWPDALGGAALAGAAGGPILLTEPDALPSAVLDEIQRLGASRAYVLGGTAAVSTAVESALKAKLGAANVTRLDGADRYETARLVAAETVRLLGSAYDGTAFVATGANFPDALGASPLAAAKGWPIFLVRPTGADDALEAAMKAVGVDAVLVLGGTAAVPAAVESDLAVRVPAAYTRLEGDDRYETAIDVAIYGVTTAGLQWDGIALATGANFPDALAGGPLQGRIGSVLLLTPTESLYAAVGTTLAAHASEIGEIRFLGGTSALSQAVRDAAITAVVP